MPTWRRTDMDEQLPIRWKGLTETKVKSRRIIYSRGFPCGAPLVMLRGGGLNVSGVKGFLRERDFKWDGRLHAWTTYLNAPELRSLLNILRTAYGCEILPKEGMDANYVLDLDADDDRISCPFCGDPSILKGGTHACN